jgi:hypothetical protein
MAHFAELDENDTVINVTVVNNDVITVDGIESEQKGIEFLESLYGHGRWKQTSYNGNIRKNYAFPGCVYDQQWNIFRTPQPYPSWKLDYETFKWVPPTPKPGKETGYIYVWSEINKEWIKYSLQTGEKE